MNRPTAFALKFAATSAVASAAWQSALGSEDVEVVAMGCSSS
jgi:hypothetical protein